MISRIKVTIGRRGKETQKEDSCKKRQREENVL
jgi:hypothetical protein